MLKHVILTVNIPMNQTFIYKLTVIYHFKDFFIVKLRTINNFYIYSAIALKNTVIESGA